MSAPEPTGREALTKTIEELEPRLVVSRRMLERIRDDVIDADNPSLVNLIGIVSSAITNLEREIMVLADKVKSHG